MVSYIILILKLFGSYLASEAARTISHGPAELFLSCEYIYSKFHSLDEAERVKRNCTCHAIVITIAPRFSKFKPPTFTLFL